jgi:hypothetical protein
VLQEVYRPRKVFSLAEATKTLPLVSRIIQDIVRVNDDLVKAHERARRLAQAGRSVQAEEAADRVHDLGHEIRGLVEELERIGCLCKDPVRGLVDFPCRVGTEDSTRIVFLCWKLGEPEIQFYHEVDAGFAGRKPVKCLFQ